MKYLHSICISVILTEFEHSLCVLFVYISSLFCTYIFNGLQLQRIRLIIILASWLTLIIIHAKFTLFVFFCLFLMNQNYKFYNFNRAFLWWFSGKESICQCRRHRFSLPGSGRSPGEGDGNHSSILTWGNPMDRGAWRATVNGVTKGWKWLSNQTATIITSISSLCPFQYPQSISLPYSLK